MGYTKTQLLEVEDVAAKHGMGDAHEVRFATTALDAEQTGVSLHHLRPGRRQPFGHRHQEAEEVVVVLEGGGRVRLDDEIVDLAPMDALRIGPEVARRFEAGPDGLRFLVFGARHQGDGEVLRDFWAD